MTPQTFSLKMCRHLSSLAPGFEGHYYYGKHKDKVEIYCTDEINTWNSDNPTGEEIEKICPAWQVEDLFRNWMKIIIALPNEKCNGFCSVCEKQGCRSVACRFYGLKAPQIPFGSFVTARIIDMLALDGDTAYQKIEEYLCSILK